MGRTHLVSPLFVLRNEDEGLSKRLNLSGSIVSIQ